MKYHVGILYSRATVKMPVPYSIASIILTQDNIKETQKSQNTTKK